MRTGGVEDGKRYSSYEWFEPFLKNGIHYIRTSIDDLNSTISKIQSLREDEIHRISKLGHMAFKALYNKTTLQCYARLTITNQHRRYNYISVY